MGFNLPPEASKAGYGLVTHETIGSTSSDAMERLRAGEPGPVWVVSSHQTQGRGRRGSAWQTEPGNLAASLGLHMSADPAAIATLGFVAGLALVRALDKSCGSGVAFRLKWPNDVLANGAKLAGILLETETTGQARAVVIGIGVNVLHAPEGLAYPTASLAGLGLPVRADELFSRLATEWVSCLGTWDQGRGFSAVRSSWLEHAAGLGEPASVRSGAHLTTGTIETIDQRGQLVLRSGAGGLQTISAGEVYFGTASTVRGEKVA